MKFLHTTADVFLHVMHKKWNTDMHLVVWHCKCKFWHQNQEIYSH